MRAVLRESTIRRWSTKMLSRFTFVVAAIALCGCTASNDRPQQSNAKNKPADPKVRPLNKPFMEHPSGDFETAVDAMADTIKRLRALPKSSDWITFSAQ